MKRVLVVTTLRETIESFLIPHIKALEEAGYQVDLACNMDRDFYIEELAKNKWHPLSFTRNPFSIGNFKSIFQLRKLIGEEDYDIIHLHTPVAAFLGRLAARTLKRKNIIYTAHGFHFYKGAPLKNWLIYYPIEFLAMRWTDKLITINQEDYGRAKKMAGRRAHIYKVDGVGLDLKKYSAGDGAKIKRELNLSKDDFIVTVIGEANRNKNQIQLIKAIEILEEKYKAIIVGGGVLEEELKEYVRSKKLENRVKFLKYRPDINDIVAASDVLASMSYREGLPRNIMEGMAQGKPYIVTNIRGNRDIVKDGTNGFQVDVGRSDLTAHYIKKLEDKNLLNRIRTANLKEVERYSYENILERVRDIVTKEVK